MVVFRIRSLLVVNLSAHSRPSTAHNHQGLALASMSGRVQTQRCLLSSRRCWARINERTAFTYGMYHVCIVTDGVCVLHINSFMLPIDIHNILRPLRWPDACPVVVFRICSWKSVRALTSFHCSLIFVEALGSLQWAGVVRHITLDHTIQEWATQFKTNRIKTLLAFKTR